VVCCVFVMMWGATGVLHPIMSRLSPQAATPRPPANVINLSNAIEPSVVLQRAGIAHISSLNVVSMNDVSYFQVTPLDDNKIAENVANQRKGDSRDTNVQSSPSSPPPLSHQEREEDAPRRYFNTVTGDELLNGDIEYAKLLARHFTKDNASTITSVEFVSDFTDDYLDVNRLLPVYRVNFDRDDGLRIYVETSPSRVATLVDNKKATMGSVFRFIHTWIFMGDDNPMRKIIVTTLLLFIFSSAVSGIVMYTVVIKRNNGMSVHGSKRWHRNIAIVVSASTLLFSSSGLWHLLGSETRTTAPTLRPAIAANVVKLPDTIRNGQWSSLNVLSLNNHLYFAVQPVGSNGDAGKPEPSMQEHAHHHGASEDKDNNSHKSGSSALYVAESNEPAKGIERQHVVALANYFSQLPENSITDINQVTSFTGEYGFVNKRLPVWKVDYDDNGHSTYYIETRSNTLASVVRNADRAEGYSFAYLHKYHWLDFAGTNVRDTIMAIFGLGNVVVAGLGLWVFVRRSRKSHKGSSDAPFLHRTT